MKHIPLFSIAALLLFSACKQQAGKNSAEPADTLSATPVKALLADPPLEGGNVILSEEDFGPLIELEGRHQLLDEEGPIFKLSESEILFVNGYLLFQNRPAVGMMLRRNADGTSTVKPLKSGDGVLSEFFHWYRLPDFRYLVSMGPLGSGPGEFVYPHLVQACTKAAGGYLYETTTEKLYSADTTGVLKQMPVEFKKQKENAYSDRQIVVATPDTLYSVDNVRGGKALFRTLLKGDSTVTEQIYNLSFSKKHRGWAAYIGDFAMSPSGNRLVYAYKYFRKLVVMDKEARTVRDISFDAEGVDAKDNVKTLGPDNVTYYWGISATDTHFFLVYSGRTPLKVGQETNKGDGYIFVEQYDWAGTPVARYRLNHWGRVFSDGTTLYQLCAKYDDPLILYTLPENK